MELREAVELIKPALLKPRARESWADLGSGEGMFTRALATLLHPGSVVHAVDRSAQVIDPSFEGTDIVFHKLDFVVDALPFEQLNGVLMANSLHFVRDKDKLLSRLRKHIRPGGSLVLVEYDVENGNQWVPYPVPYAGAKVLLEEAGFEEVTLVGERISVYGGRKMYACNATNG